MKGVQFVVDDTGKKKAVLIDLRIHGRAWEDFYDGLIAMQRVNDPVEPLESVKKRILGEEK
jgi:hypothetical protein